MKNSILKLSVEDNTDTHSKSVYKSLDDFFNIVGSIPVAVIITSVSKWSFVKVNDNFTNMFGFTGHEVIGKTLLELKILDKAELQRIVRIVKTERKIQNEIFICKTKGKKIVYAVVSSELIQIAGIKYAVSSFHDISRFKEQQIIIERQNKEIIDSISYARLIQKALLPTQKQIELALPDSFILAIPKDIISGDFYWLEKYKNKTFIAVCDCTGHGVPGAFISIIGYKLLSKFIVEYGFSSPAKILNHLNNDFSVANKEIITTTLQIRDGMDMALCVIDKTEMTMSYAGAYNPVYQVRMGVLTKLTVDRIPIHLFTSHTGEKFKDSEIEIEVGDMYYMFSDGYADQFGGPRGKKFLSKKFQELILSVQHESMGKQKEILCETIEDWRRISDEDQTDDILVLGFKIS